MADAGRAPTTALVLLGKGGVAGALLDILARVQLPGVRVVAIAGRSERALDPAGLPLDRWRSALTPGAPDLDALLRCAAGHARTVVVDCTAADGMERVWLEALERGADVVAANKKPLVAPLSTRRALEQAAKRARRSLRCETTVGAGLPVIGPLRDLVRTGDEVRRIEGSLSGTLAYLCGELGRGVPLSRAVASAKELGYTEPHPGEDLSGADVARKALILAREAGLMLELEALSVQPFVDTGHLREPDADAFVRALGLLDAEMASRVAEQERAGRVLRYLARIDVEARQVEVGPRWVERDHPAAQLKGTESLITFSTARYRDHPMRIQGPGAGVEVTAAGVLADVLALG